jgi:hypothetical protein
MRCPRLLRPRRQRGKLRALNAGSHAQLEAGMGPEKKVIVFFFFIKIQRRRLLTCVSMWSENNHISLF